MTEKATIGLDYSHNNLVTLEASSYADFTNFLFTSGYKLGKIQAGFESVKKLENYSMIFLSTPRNHKLTENEIKVLVEYVKTGGNLFIISTAGSDHNNNTNLNELTKHFGFEFNLDQVNDSMNYLNLQKRPLLTKFTPHFITEQIKKLVYSSACSLKILDFVEDKVNVKIETLAVGGLNCWRKRYNTEERDWVQEDCPKIPLLAAIEYYQGKVVTFGSLSMFSSLGSEYGFSAFDNDIIIANIFRYLTSKSITEGKAVTVNINLDLFYWANALLHNKDGNWETISDIVNLSLKYFKDNYKEILDHIKRLQLDKLQQKKEYEEAKSDSQEDKILEMVTYERKREDLEDIMSALEEITGEKYEFTIDLEEQKEEKQEEKSEEEALEEPIKETEVPKKKPVKKTDDHELEVVGLSEKDKINNRIEQEEKKKLQALNKAIGEKEVKIKGPTPEKEKIDQRIDRESQKERERLEEILGKSVEGISEKVEVKGAKLEREKIQKRIINEYERERKQLEQVLAIEMEEELKAIMGQAIEDLDSKVGEEKAEKIESELKKSLTEDVDKIKDGILERAKQALAKESVEIFNKVLEEIKKTAPGEIDLDAIIKRVKKALEAKRSDILKNVKSRFLEDRDARIKAIKERELEIIKENQKFLDGILEATEFFELPSLDLDLIPKDKKKSDN